MTTPPLYGQSDVPAVPKLPTTIVLPDGLEYDVAGDVWVLPEDPGLAATVRIDWTLLTGVVIPGTSTPVMSSRALALVKLYVLERMSTVGHSIKPASAKNIQRAVLIFARWLATSPEWLHTGRGFEWADLTEEMFDAWLTMEYRTKRKGHLALRLRGFYCWGADPDAGFPDFSDSLASTLRGQRFIFPLKGKLVESRDKRRGPFTREELELIFKACKTGAGKDHDRAVAWILLETAIRPKQIYLLTNQDVIDVAGDGSLTADTYQLRVRKIKQRGNTVAYHFLPLSKDCARLLLDSRRPGSAPDEPVFWWLGRYYEQSILRSLKSFSVDADLRATRLPIENPDPSGPIYERLHISPRRFRYAIATDRIAREESLEDVAEMLGHEGTDNVRVYAETSPAITDVFQRATDYALAPIIDLMEGRTVPSDVNSFAEVVPPTPPTLRLRGDAPIFRRGIRPFHSYQDQRPSQSGYLSIEPAQSGDKSEARIKELVARARRKFPVHYPGQDFDAQVWDASHLKERPNTNTAVRFGFTTLVSTRGNRNRLSLRPEDALPAYYSDVIKSWLVLSCNITVVVNAYRLIAARHFWNSILKKSNGQAAAFVWKELSEDDLLAFEQYLRAYKTRQGNPYSPDTVLKHIQDIQRLVVFLASRGICRHIDYVPQTASTRATTTRQLEEEKLAAARKLPAPGVLESLAGIYYRLTIAPAGEVSDWMLIVISAVAMLILTGLRVGELVTMPFDCEVEEIVPTGRPGDPNRYRYGIRYWLEKSKGKTMRVRWISPTAERVVRASVARIKRLTAAARERAKVLEANPAKMPLPPEVASRTILTRPELVALLGYRRDRTIMADPSGLLPQHGRGRASYFYVKDLESFLLSKRVPHLYTVRHDDGTFQTLSDSLFIIFAKQSRALMMDPCRLLVEPVTRHMIYAYLCSATSLFKIYGEAEWERGLSTHPHCFRHWLIHVAYKGGMETHLALRYFAKQYASGLADYLHFSTDECDACDPEELNAEDLYVPV